MIARIIRGTALAIALGLPAQAAWAGSLQISASAEEPSGQSIVSCPPSAASDIRMYYLEGEPLKRRDVGQIFEMTENASVSRLALATAPLANAVGGQAHGAAVVLRVYDYTSPDADAPAKEIAEIKGKLPEDLDGGQHLLLDFPPVALQSGKTYAFVLAFADAKSDQYLNLSTAPQRAYTEGSALLYSTTKDNPDLHYQRSHANLVFSLSTK